jgi:hypothetical protein
MTNIKTSMTSDRTTWGRVNQRKNLREFEVNRSEKGCGAMVVSVINLLLSKGLTQNPAGKLLPVRFVANLF